MLVRLDLKHYDENRLALRIPLRVRIVPGAVAGWLLYAMLSDGLAGILARGNIVPLLLFLACLLGTLYEDCWFFNRSQKQVMHKTGLLFAAAKTVLPFSELQRIVLAGTLQERKGKGSQPAESEGVRASVASYVTLALETTTGRRYRVEHYRGPRAGTLIRLGAEIGRLSDLPVADEVRRPEY